MGLGNEVGSRRMWGFNGSGATKVWVGDRRRWSHIASWAAVVTSWPKERTTLTTGFGESGPRGRVPGRRNRCYGHKCGHLPSKRIALDDSATLRLRNPRPGQTQRARPQLRRTGWALEAPRRLRGQGVREGPDPGPAAQWRDGGGERLPPAPNLSRMGSRP